MKKIYELLIKLRNKWSVYVSFTITSGYSIDNKEYICYNVYTSETSYHRLTTQKEVIAYIGKLLKMKEKEFFSQKGNELKDRIAETEADLRNYKKQLATLKSK